MKSDGSWVIVEEPHIAEPRKEDSLVSSLTFMGKLTINWKPLMPEIDSREIFWRVLTDSLSHQPMNHPWFTAQEYRMGNAGLLWRKLKGVENPTNYRVCFRPGPTETPREVATCETIEGITMAYNMCIILFDKVVKDYQNQINSDADRMFYVMTYLPREIRNLSATKSVDHTGEDDGPLHTFNDTPTPHIDNSASMQAECPDDPSVPAENAPEAEARVENPGIANSNAIASALDFLPSEATAEASESLTTLPSDAQESYLVASTNESTVDSTAEAKQEPPLASLSVDQIIAEDLVAPDMIDAQQELPEPDGQPAAIMPEVVVTHDERSCHLSEQAEVEGVYGPAFLEPRQVSLISSSGKSLDAAERLEQLISSAPFSTSAANSSEQPIREFIGPDVPVVKVKKVKSRHTKLAVVDDPSTPFTFDDSTAVPPSDPLHAEPAGDVHVVKVKKIRQPRHVVMDDFSNSATFFNNPVNLSPRSRSPRSDALLSPSTLPTQSSSARTSFDFGERPPEKRDSTTENVGFFEKFIKEASVFGQSVNVSVKEKLLEASRNTHIPSNEGRWVEEDGVFKTF